MGIFAFYVSSGGYADENGKFYRLTLDENEHIDDFTEQLQKELEHEISSYVILDKEVFSITAVNDKFDNGVIWNMDGHTFDLWGKVPVDELIKIAESMSHVVEK